MSDVGTERERDGKGEREGLRKKEFYARTEQERGVRRETG